MEGAQSVDLRVIREDEEIIHIDNKPSLSNHILGGIIHKPLEGGRGVAQFKEHDSGFEEPFVSDEGGLPLVSFLDLNIVISRPDIHLGEDRCSFKLVNKVRDQRKGVDIFDSVFVQVMIILTRAEGAILLSYKEEWGCLRQLGGSDFSFPKVVLDKLFSSFLFIWRQGVCFSHL